jgi:hypothetical protein
VTVIITLSPEWEARAVELAEAKLAECVGLDRVQADGRTIDPEQRYQNNLMSYRAEFAIAKYTQLPWRQWSGDFNQADVGDNVEVRARNIPGSGGDLPLRPKDDEKLERPFVLVHVHENDGTIEAIGWLFGYEARARGGPERFSIVYVPPPYRDMPELLAEVRDPRVRYCAICGVICNLGYGPPGWPVLKYFCGEHRPDALR